MPMHRVLKFWYPLNLPLASQVEKQHENPSCLAKQQDQLREELHGFSDDYSIYKVGCAGSYFSQDQLESSNIPTYRIPNAINVTLADSCSSLLADHFLVCGVVFITSWTDSMIPIRRSACSELASFNKGISARLELTRDAVQEYKY